jgi:hypothetical protein
MIKESLLALSLATGGDLYTTEKGRSLGFGERNPLCASTGKCIAYSAAWTAIGTFTVDKVQKKHGKKAGWVVLGIFCAVPIGAAVHNGVKIW